MAPGELGIRRLPASRIEEVLPIWATLYAAHADGALTTSWEWVTSWLDAYGDLVPYSFAVGEQGGQVRGIALITEGVHQKLGPVPIRTLHIGTAGEPADESVMVEYNRVLVAEDSRLDFTVVLINHLHDHRSRGQEITLNGFAPEDAAPFLQACPEMFVRREPCPTADLAAIRAGDGDVIAALGKSTRYNIRRSLRLFGEIETEWCQEAEQAGALLDELIELHQRRWVEAGQPGAFASSRFLAFHRALIARLLPQQRAFLFRVRSARGTIGVLYGFIEFGQVLFYQSGFAEVQDEKLKPGLVTHALCMQACLDRGIDAYNFLQGDSRYKRELSTTERELIWAVDRPGGVKSRLLTLARQRKYAATASHPSETVNGDS